MIVSKIAIWDEFRVPVLSYVLGWQRSTPLMKYVKGGLIRIVALYLYQSSWTHCILRPWYYTGIYQLKYGFCYDLLFYNLTSSCKP